jgi:hypothetical protein
LEREGTRTKNRRHRIRGLPPYGPQRPAFAALSSFSISVGSKCQDDWEFAGPDDAKAEIRAAVEYLLRGATGGARGDILREIIANVRQVASGLPPPEQSNPLDDDMPGG